MAISHLKMSNEVSRVGVVQFAELVDKKNAITFDDSVTWTKTKLVKEINNIQYKGKHAFCNTRLKHYGLELLDASVGEGIWLMLLCCRWI